MATDARRALGAAARPATSVAWRRASTLASCLALATSLTACGGGANLQQLLSSLPSLPAIGSAEPGQTETGALGEPAAQTGVHEAAVSVEGTPTIIFTQVSHRMLGCWFAVDGPLRASHIHRAEALPPAKGGDAEIVIHERDETVRDLRGPRVYKITFTPDGMGTQVSSMAMKHDWKTAQAMARDVESWAKGGDSCQLRTLVSPPVPAVAAKADGKAAAKSTKPASDAKASKAAAKAAASPPGKTTTR